MKRILTAAVVAVAALFVATACSSGGGGGEVVAPVIVDLQEVDGTTVELPMDSTVDLTGDDETYTDWEAEIADASVAEFVSGKDDGSAQFNPGLTPLAPGSTDVTLKNSASGDEVSFTLTVTE